jgi:5-methylcytosine-specific restriction endonuclease McrA
MVRYRADSTSRVQKKLAAGQKCPYCRRTMEGDVHGVRDLSPTVDHVITQGRRGDNHPENLIWCCKRCNNLRGSVPYDVFVAFSRYVLIQFPNHPAAFLRNALREFVYWLAFAALGKKDDVNHAVRMSLLQLAGDMENAK